jgi:phosphomannomutase
MVDDVAAEHNCVVHRSRVGEVNVVERMIDCDSGIGGEGNGGVIMRRVNPCRDSFVGMALLLEALAKEGGTISQMRAKVPTYAMVKEKLPCPAREIASALRRVAYEFREAQIDRTDGLKIVWPDRWVQARGSNTEPIIRITAEAPTEPDARALVIRTIESIKPA